MRLRFFCLAFCFLAFAQAGRPDVARASNGWDLLWSNHYAEAEHIFRQEAGTGSVDGWRGLGWLCYLRADTHGALGNWAKVVKAAPSDWRSQGLWLTMSDIADNRFDYSALMAAAGSMSSDRRVDSRLAASAAYARLEMGSASSQATVPRTFGYLTNWRVIGPFENVSKSGFDKAFAPERTIDLRSVETGREALPVRWRKCPLVDVDASIAVGAYLNDGAPDIFYQVTAFQCTADVDSQLRYDVAGASKIYVNGKLAQVNHVYTTPIGILADSHTVDVHLNRGWNTVLVKLASDSKVTCCSAFRFVDKGGRPISFAAVDPSRANGQAVTADMARADDVHQFQSQSTVDTDGPAPGDLAEDLLGGHVDTVEGALLLAYYERTVNNLGRAEAILRRAIAANPSCAALHAELCETLQKDGLTDDARSECTLTHRLTHGIAGIEVTDFTNSASSFQYAGAVLQGIRSLAKQFPESDEIAFAYATGLAKFGDQTKAYEIGRKQYDRHPGHKTLLLLDDLLSDDRSHDAELRRLFVTEQAEHPLDTELINRFAILLNTESQYKAALLAYRKCIALEPCDLDRLTDAADVCDTMGDKKSSISFRERYCELRPQDGAAWAALAAAYENAGKTNLAIQAYRVAVALSPSQLDARNKLKVLTGEKPVVDIVPPLPTPDLKTVDGQNSTDASAVDLVDDTRVVVHPDYYVELRCHQVIRVNNQAGVGKYQTFPMQGLDMLASQTLERALLIKADGTVVDQTNSGQDTLIFPSLSPGDTMDVTYRVTGRATGALARNFWTDWHCVTPNVVVNSARFALITPAGMDYTYVNHNGAPSPTTSTVKGWQVRRWTYSNTAPLKDEYEATPSNDWAPWVDVSTVKSWSTIVDWYRDLSAECYQPDSAVRAKAMELTKQDKTPEEMLRSCVDYVSHDIQYQSAKFRLSAYIPTLGRQVIRERYGDCKDKAALLTALLASVGIPSHMVLTTPFTIGGTTGYLPSPRFDHAIAVVDMPSGQRWIDGTADGMPYDQTPWDDQSSPSLVIRPGTNQLTPIPTDFDNDTMDTAFNGTVEVDGPSPVDVRMTYMGNYAYVTRATVVDLTPDKRTERLRSNCRDFGNLSFESGAIDGIDNPDVPIDVTIKGSFDDMAQKVGNYLILTLPWSENGDAERRIANLSAENRVSSVVLTERGTVTMEVALKLPAGYAPATLPESVTESAPYQSYSIAYAFGDGVLTATLKEHLTASQISAGDLDGYLRFIKKKYSELSKRVLLEKTAA